ncbi:hypothetical protein G3580_17925 [Nitrogeniibacter mangrovi]|uniref:Uncharacterized protein n=1 Tax=Nitrogeniibacter mangrovi TaxID=2016596 RepID=A0A6C1B775_9RHOO|nr:hypothetical protein [Nitrogeniibacter mangrovi]QID19327.1 hypothetical protein G3580_17925 [Nitrogeniibacter mangrovi]
MTPQSVETLMEDIEREDPLDFGLLSIDEQDARQLMANHFCEVNAALSAHGLDVEARLEIMTAIAAHTMVENLLLNVERLQGGAAGADFTAWLKRHGMS